MNNKLALFNLQQRAYRFITVGIYPIIFGVFVVLLCIQIYSVYTVYGDLQSAIQTRDTIKAKLDRYRNNARISDAQRIAYGTVIQKQVPKTNDVFDQFSLIDSFYQRTGIELKGTSSLKGRGASARSASNQNTGATNYLIGRGTMNEATLDEIMNMYQYQFHRFMTLNTVSVKQSKEGQGKFYDVELTFQVYNMSDTKQADASGASRDIVFTALDLSDFENYMNNTNIDIYYEMQSASPVTTDYETADSIF